MNNQSPPRIDPTVGRVLYYFERQALTRNGQTGVFLRGPLAAIVCAVRSPRVVNLAVHNESGTSYGVEGVFLVQPGELPPEHGNYAQWMPFQVGQATNQASATKSVIQDAFKETCFPTRDYTLGARGDMGMPDTDHPGACESQSGVAALNKRIDERVARGLSEFHRSEGRVSDAMPRNYAQEELARTLVESERPIPADPRND